MTQEDFLNHYQLLYRKLNNIDQWIVIDKRKGDTVKKYNFQVDSISAVDFELFTGKNLSEEFDKILISQLQADFNITE